MIKFLVFVILTSAIGVLYNRVLQKEKGEFLHDKTIRASRFEFGACVGGAILGLILAIAGFIIDIKGNPNGAGVMIVGLCFMSYNAVAAILIRRWKIIVGEAEIIVVYCTKPRKVYQIEEIDKMVVSLFRTIKLYSKGKKVVAIGMTSRGYQMIYDTFKGKLVRNEYEEVMKDVPEDDEEK